MANAELSQAEWNKRREVQIKLKDEKLTLGGDLPTRKDSLEKAANCSLKMMDRMTEIIGSPETEISQFLEKAVRKCNTTVGHLPKSDKFTIDGQIMTVNLMQDIREHFRERDADEKRLALRNAQFSNEEWLNFITICGSCDTVDTNNILTLWNVIRTPSDAKLNTQNTNPQGTHETCNFVEISDWERSTCSNFINTGDNHCSIHRAMKNKNEITNTSKSTFPVKFGSKIFYVLNVNIDRDLEIKQKEILRKDATTLHQKALGN